MAKGRYSEFHQELHPYFELGSLTQLKARYVVAGEKPKLKMLNIEPTNACNMNCVFCTNKLQEEFSMMPMDLYSKIIKDLRNQPQLLILNFHKDGEPLLHEDIVDMVTLASTHNVAQTYHMNTNGSHMNYHTAKQLLKAGLNDITFSVDAYLQTTFNKLKGNNLLGCVERGVMDFLQAKRDTRAACCVRVKIMEHELVTKTEIDMFYDFWKHHVDQVQITGCHDWSGAVNVPCTDLPEDGAPKRYPCNLLWYTLAVNSDGSVSPCNLDWNRKMIAGNVRKESLPNIFANSFELIKLRHQHVQNKCLPQTCEDCVVWASGMNLGRWYGNHC